jgi:hypothetical protein
MIDGLLGWKSYIPTSGCLYDKKERCKMEAVWVEMEARFDPAPQTV